MGPAALKRLPIALLKLTERTVLEVSVKDLEASLCGPSESFQETPTKFAGPQVGSARVDRPRDADRLPLFPSSNTAVNRNLVMHSIRKTWSRQG